MRKESILEIDTDDFYITFLGPLPNKESFVLKDFIGGIEEKTTGKVLGNISYPSGVEVYPLLRIETESSKYNSDNCEIIINTKIESGSDVRYLPLFFENIDYQVQLTPKKKKEYTLWHEHSSINSNLAYFEKHNLFSGTFNFKNNVGVTEFQIKENRATLFCLVFTVFSIKIDFLNERDYMIQDLIKVHNKLIFELYNPTKSKGVSEQEKATGTEWLSTFYMLSQELIHTIRRIEKKSHSQLKLESVIIDVEKIKRPNKSLNKQINKFGKRDVYQQRKIITDVKTSNVNTSENRYIKYLIQQIINITDKWINHLHSGDPLYLQSIIKEQFYIKVTENIRKIKQTYKNGFWNKVDANSSIKYNKTNFLFHNEFIHFEKLFKILSRAVDIQIKGSRYIYTLSMEDLYEVWTFFKITALISGIVYKREDAISLKIQSDAFKTVLLTGKTSQIRIGNDIIIATNRLFNTTLTNTYFSPFVSQKPDIVFEIKNKNKLNILDAKYKIDVLVLEGGKPVHLNNADLISKDLSNSVVFYQPKDEDINTMHRYRDAIRVNTLSNGVIKRSHAVYSGFILYPHKPMRTDVRLINDYLAKLREFRIGAIPLSPGLKDKNWLEEYKNEKELIPDDANIEQVRILANLVQDMLND